MSGVDREILLHKVGRHSSDLDFMVNLVGFQPDHDGPFTVEINKGELDSFMDAEGLTGARYVIAEGENGSWTHILDGKNDSEIRFVYDREEERLVYCEIPGGFNQDGQYFVPGSDDVNADVEDHLKNANEGALNNPLDWDLHIADEMPDWVPRLAAPKI
jgi:hypothetical protein